VYVMLILAAIGLAMYVGSMFTKKTDVFSFSGEQAKTLATRINDDFVGFGQAFDNMQLRGFQASEVVWNGAPAYTGNGASAWPATALAAGDTSYDAQMFDPVVGTMKAVPLPPSSAFVTGLTTAERRYFFSDSVVVKGSAGGVDLVTSATERAVMAVNVRQDVCLSFNNMHWNDTLKPASPATVIPQSGLTLAQVVTTSGSVSFNTSNAGEQARATGCVQTSDTPVRYVAFQVLSQN